MAKSEQSSVAPGPKKTRVERIAVLETQMQQVATKSDMLKMGADLRAEISEMKSELQGQISEMGTRMIEMDAKRQGEISELKSKLNLLLWGWPIAMAMMVAAIKL